MPSKKRLLARGWTEECTVCGIGPEWNGIRLSLQVDHVNGIHTDNRLTNLRLICPNCHSQTETFAGRANRKPPKPRGPRKPATRKSATRKSHIDWPETDVLAQMVRDTNASQVGRALGVSDNAVRKRLMTRGSWPVAKSSPSASQLDDQPDGLG